MAWLYKRNDSGLWWVGIRANGRQILKSTGERDEEKARAKLASLEAMEAAQRAGRLNREFFEALTGAHIETTNLSASLNTWLKETSNANTRRNYESFAKQLKTALPHDPLLADITHEQVREFLADVRAKKRPSTANLMLACAKAFFGRFKGSVRKDPTEGIPRFKEDATKIERQAFTPEQIQSVMAIATDFWRCASALSFYTGLRLSNVATLKAGQLKGDKVVVARTIKTGAPVCVKLPASIAAMIRQQIPRGAKADDYIWPEQAKHVEHGDVTNLSSQFATLLLKAGLREERDAAGNGLSGRRNVNPLTFHSLRHSLISALANQGVNQQVVKKLVGHASDRINDAYTHIKQDTLDKAVALLPDITKAEGQ